MRLIDADLIDMDDMDFHTSQTRAMACEAAQDIVDAQPTVEAEPVVHAHWVTKSIGSSVYYCCSKCGATFWGCSKYCGGCGARMNGEV